MRITNVVLNLLTKKTSIYDLRDNLIMHLDKLIRRNKGIRIIDEDWDNLIILDDCRYDIFEKIFKERNMGGKLEWKISRGTWTVEFLLENFPGDRYDDIVYITANPFVDRYLKGKFYKIISVWKYEWDSKYNTVLPSAMYKYTLEALRNYPNKRFIIHFLQPHHPYFVLKFEDKLMNEIRDAALQHRDFKSVNPKKSFFDVYLTALYAWFDLYKLIKAYEENLRLTMPYIEKLIHLLPGKTVITSDHGESFGERFHHLFPIRIYGHGMARIESLIKVPWLVVDERDKLNLRDLKRLKKEITKIEKTLKIETKTSLESQKLKKAIKNLKLKGII